MLPTLTSSTPIDIMCCLLAQGRPLEGFISRRPAVAAAAKSLQSCLTLCDPLDGSPSGSSVPRILQASGLPFPSPMHACMLSHFSRI